MQDVWQTDRHICHSVKYLPVGECFFLPPYARSQAPVDVRSSTY
jgi:hypothetical protein